MVTLGEKYNLRKVCYAIENLETILSKTTKKNPEYIKQTLLKILQKNGEIKVQYNYATKASCGRQYSKLAFQALDKNTRNFLLNGEGIYDIDMVSSAPSTLKYLAEQYEITKIPCLTEYVSDRSAVIKKYGVTKQEVNYLLFETDKKVFEKQWLRNFQDEVFKISEKLTNHKDFTDIKKYVLKKKGNDNNTGSILAEIIFKYENKFLMELKREVESKKINIFALQFDGLFTYNSINDLDSLNTKIQTKTGNPFLKVALKSIETKIVIPDDYVYSDKKRNTILRKYSRDYETVKTMWEDENETNATLIIGSSSYFVKVNGDWKNFTEKGLRTSFRHMKFEDHVISRDGETKLEDKCFIDKWIDDENIQKKTNIVNYYDKKLVGENDLNICEPFAVNKWVLRDYKYDEESVNVYRHHLLSLCNFEEKSAQFLEKWFAHLFQMPDIKTGVCVVITGKEGNGKDTAIDFPALIMGRSKRYITSQPEKDVWGHFNSMMSSCCLVQLSEIDRMNTNTHMGKIKDIITNPTITIEDKGVKPYITQSNHNFIGTTNNELPFNLGDNQRRIAIVNASSKYIGNKEYFMKLYKMQEDKNALKSIYEYFMKLENVPKKFSLEDINVSQYQEEMKTHCTDEVIEFIKYRCFAKKNEIELVLVSDLLTDFTHWRYENKLPNKDWNSKSFGIRMTKLMMIDLKDCIGKVHTRKGSEYSIDYALIYNLLNLKDVL